MSDASFNSVDPGPLMLRAEDGNDLTIVSALVQDAVLTVGDISYDPRTRKLALLINRFRWEDAAHAKVEQRPFERVRALLVVSDVTTVKSDGITRDDKELVLELLALKWQEGEDGTGILMLEFAGDGTLAVGAECLNLDLRDVTRPYVAPSGQQPSHPE